MSSGGEVRKVSRQDIQLVQNLIERCLQLYMNQKEVVNTLLIQAKIEPSFTELVWQKLEEENREFFKAYHVRLIVKNQIMMFNQLLEKQAQLMREVQPAINGASMSLSNGSNASSLRQMHLQYASAPRPAQAYFTVFQSSVINGGLSSNQGMQAANGSSNDGRIDMSTGMLPFHNQNMSLGVIQGANGISMKSEASSPNTSEFRFCTDGSFLEERSTMGDPSGSSFGCTELNGPPGNDPLLDTIDATAFGFLSHIPRNLSFSNLTDHDILETYGKSPFLDPETNEFSASLIAENEGDKKRLDSISEGYDGFSD